MSNILVYFFIFSYFLQYKKYHLSWALVTHTYNLATHEAEIKIEVSGQPGQIVHETPSWKYPMQAGHRWLTH
jgi:hypothetical protein